MRCRFATTHETSPEFTKPPYYAALSECDGVYGGAQHWAILADECRGIVADIEGGLTPEAKAKAEFIVRACNAHESLFDAAERAYGVLCDLAYHKCFRGKFERFSEGNDAIEALATAINNAHEQAE